MQELRRSLPRPGRVEWIGLREGRRLPVQSVPHAEAHPLVGLLGDHGKTAPGRLRAISGEVGEEVTPPAPPPSAPSSGWPQSGWSGPGKRQVTLIQAEHLPVIAALAGLDTVTPEELRRNIVVQWPAAVGPQGRPFSDRRSDSGGHGRMPPLLADGRNFWAGGLQRGARARRNHGAGGARRSDPGGRRPDGIAGLTFFGARDPVC